MGNKQTNSKGFMLFILATLVVLTAASPSSVVRDTKGEVIPLRRQRQPFVSVPPGPAGANGGGVKTLPDGDVVYDYWNATSDKTMNPWGGTGTPTYCQPFTSPEVAMTLKDFWIAVPSGQNSLSGWVAVVEYTGSNIGSVLYNSSTPMTVASGANQYSLDVQLQEDTEYIFCISNFDGTSTPSEWLGQDVIPSGFAAIYNNDDVFDNSFGTWIGSLIFYARFSGGGSSGESTCTNCTEAGEVWCLDDSTCYSTPPASCEDYISLPSHCPVDCSSQDDCSSCTSQSGHCVWCVDSAESGCFPKDSQSHVCNVDKISKSQYCQA